MLMQVRCLFCLLNRCVGTFFNYIFVIYRDMFIFGEDQVSDFY